MSDVSLVQPPYPWFLEAWQHFTEQIRAGRLPHALLLKGISGMGAGELAQAMAHFLLCRSPADRVSCGRCRSCDLVAAGFHPDCFLLEPEDGSAVIKIGQVRALNHFISATAQQGGRKLVVINPVEAMNVEASNALLKNLEEPSGDTVFVLVAHQIARVLPTIRSRTSQMTLPTPDWATSLAWLKKNDMPEAEKYLMAVGGGPVLARQWQQDNKMAAHDEIAGWLLKMFDKEVSVVDAAAKLNSYDLPFALKLIQQWLQQAIKNSTDAGSAAAHPLVAALGRYHSPTLFRWLDAVHARLDQLYRGSNPNKQLAYEDLLLVMTAVRPECPATS